MTVNWQTITPEEADNELNLFRNGMRSTVPELYVLPRQAQVPHENFARRMREGKWGFILVEGENGAGKSVYVRFVEHLAQQMGYTIVHVEVNEDQMRQYGPAGYFNLQIMEHLRLPDGDTFLFKIQQNDQFRRIVAGQIAKDLATFEFFSPALTQALLHVTGGDEIKRRLATSWLRGEPKSASELKELEMFDRAAKSILNVPTDRVLYAVKELCAALDNKGVLISVDEIERIGNMPPAKGKESLSVLRDMINILVSEDSMPNKRGMVTGTFVCYAISTFFLGYSGIIEVGGVDFRAQADRYGKPKVTLGDIPRLSSVLQNSASTVPVDFEGLDDLVKIAGIVKGCYARATSVDRSIGPDLLALEAHQRTGTFLARTNIQEMVRILDSLD